MASKQLGLAGPFAHRDVKVRILQLLSMLRPLLTVRTEYPVGVTDSRTTPAAVLVIIHFYQEQSKPRIILTRRSASLRMHKSEISFPGGRYSAEDGGDLLRTALRETREEVGLEFSPNDILGTLSPVTTMTSNHLILPFVTVQERLADHRPAADEVEQIIDADLIKTLQSKERDVAHQSLREAWRFSWGRDIIWGATAGIMKELYDILIRPS